ncbi:F-box/LRR-repeat/kelch-repeat protein At2g27520 [Linum grandiflorum]
MRATSSSISRQYLPEDLIIDIQTRLPVSCFRRLSCISKSWNSKLSNPKFAYEKFFSDKEDTGADTRILITNSSVRTPLTYSCYSYDSLLPLPNDTFRRVSYEVDFSNWTRLGSCGGGLICFTPYFSGRGVWLFNPATSESKMLPPLPEPLPSPTDHVRYYQANTMCASAFLGREEDEYCRYKVVCVRPHLPFGRHIRTVHIFSSEDESSGWRELPALEWLPRLELLNEIPQFGVARKKKCYWMAKNQNGREYRLVSFDMSTEVFELVGEALPFGGVPYVYMVKEETLVVLDMEKGMMRVLRQSVVGNFWCELFSILFSAEGKRRWKPIGFSKHGKLICRDEKLNLQVLDVTTDQTSPLTYEAGDVEEDKQLAIYVPSKISLSSKFIIIVVFYQ